jgi:hypothetical protein
MGAIIPSGQGINMTCSQDAWDIEIENNEQPFLGSMKIIVFMIFVYIICKKYKNYRFSRSLL